MSTVTAGNRQSITLARNANGNISTTAAIGIGAMPKTSMAGQGAPIVTSVVVPPMRSVIFAIEAEMKKFPQVEIPTRHLFSLGLYAREITVPADALITGVIHKTPQINILSQGTIRVSIDEDVREISAPYTVVSPAGVKRIAYCVTQVVWTTIIHTFLTDVAEIEKQFFAYSEEEYQDFVKEQKQWLA